MSQNRVVIHNHEIVSALPEIGDHVTVNLGFRTDAGIWKGLEDGSYSIDHNGVVRSFKLYSVIRLTVREPKTDADHVLKAARADHVENEMTTWIAVTGRSYRDGLGALWVELHVEGEGSFWYSTEREDLADIMWRTASVESVEEIPETLQN